MWTAHPARFHHPHMSNIPRTSDHCLITLASTINSKEVAILKARQLQNLPVMDHSMPLKWEGVEEGLAQRAEEEVRCREVLLVIMVGNGVRDGGHSKV